MKVIALGGAGEMGRCAVKALLTDQRVSEIIIADRNLLAARAAAEIFGPRVTAVQIDVTNNAALIQLLSTAHYVMNAVGPFYRFGLPILRAAIAARCHYLDICDDWEAATAMLELDSEAKNAAITAIIGLGASPGISNLLAVKAVQQLDSVSELFTVWSLDAASPAKTTNDSTVKSSPSAATVHGVQQMTGLIRGFENGREVETKPLQRHEINYPGLGKRRAWSIGHPESITLPRTIKNLRTCTNLMFADTVSIRCLKSFLSLTNLGWMSVESAARWLEKIAGYLPAKSNNTWLAGDDSALDLPPLFALAVGKKNGQAASVAVAVTTAPPGGMGEATGIPLAMGVSLMLDGAINQRGVSAVEAIIEPDAMFRKMLPFCVPAVQSVQDLILISSSWQNQSIAASLQEIRGRNRNISTKPPLSC